MVTSFYETAIQKLKEWYEKYIHINGDYRKI